MKTTTKNLVLCAMCAAIICVLAPISIPIGPVPISLATFAVMFAGCLLGWKWGTLATLIYILLGAIGVPVFAGWTGGAQIIAGMTGGYIVGYLPLALISGLVYDLFGRHKKGAVKYVSLVVGMVLGTIVLYALGTAWFMAVSGMGFAESMAACVIPFLPGDAIKIAIVTIITPVIEKALSHAGVTFDRKANA